ncbi:hypothetical protein D0Z07_1847 [Hyphodiscus hymeniophilus]|uniref:Uncharacterized protein n=1 Tax=Hyphodiscus hymeniophilus TaxID=353542 RepID=A0A9P6VPG2_9HELO|nr:hypothetical protein D0Z07_1847 [Hyphodiscus hymeniophilus]
MESFDEKAFFDMIGLPKPSSMPTAAEVRKEAQERSADLLLQWDTLRRILERHEEVLRKRWLKKTKTQRTAILQSVWPKMARKHQPDLRHFAEKALRYLKTGGGTKARDSYMFPYINIEDLYRGKSLLLFLNSRGRNSPRHFAHADFNAMRLGQISGATMPPFLNLYIMLFEGESVEMYGRLVSWDDHEDAMEMVSAGLAHLPGEGLFILEIQQRILSFLNGCARAILHDMDADALISKDLPIKPEPQLIVDSADWPTMAAMAAEAPYRVPAQIDFNRLRSVIDAKRSDAADHIRSLREDPGYFADVLQGWSDHREETIIDTNGSRHPVVDKPLFWDRVLGDVVSDAYSTLIVWSITSRQLATLSSMKEKYSAAFSPKKQLPEEYTKAILTFRYTLDQLRMGPISLLKTGLPASPFFRSFFHREPPVPGSTMVRLVGSPNLREDHTFWFFSRLWDDDQLRLLGFPNLMDELEHIIQSDPKEKQKLSSWVAQIFSGLGVIARARHELDIYLPWAAGFENDKVHLEETLKREFSLTFTPMAELYRCLKDNIPFAKTGTPKGDTFYYPSDKRRTQQSVESMRRAERNLDVFWETVDDHYRKKAGKSLHDAFRHLSSNEEPLERTPEWIDPIKETPIPGPARESNGLESRISQFNVDSQGYGANFVPPTQRVKPKTRGEARTELANAEKGHLDQVDTRPTFLVTNRAFKVFKTLFYTPTTNNLPGEIA